MIAATSVTARYERAATDALQGVSCEANSGELVCVAGPNGSGKSTLLKVLGGSMRVFSGTATFQARPIGEWQPGELARQLAALTQRESTVFPLSVTEHVMLGRYAYLGPLARESATDREIVLDALKQCDVASLADRTIDTLSAGERQRVRLARALAQQPRALLLDEPTTNLDFGHEMQMFELIRQLADRGLAIVAVTHGLNLAATFADRVILLDRGRVAAVTVAGKGIDRGTIQRVFDWPVDVLRSRDGSPVIVPRRAQRRPSSPNGSNL